MISLRHHTEINTFLSFGWDSGSRRSQIVRRQGRPLLTLTAGWLSATEVKVPQSYRREFVYFIYLFTSNSPSRCKDRVMRAADPTMTSSWPHRDPSTPADSLRATHSWHDFWNLQTVGRSWWGHWKRSITVDLGVFKWAVWLKLKFWIIKEFLLVDCNCG